MYRVSARHRKPSRFPARTGTPTRHRKRSLIGSVLRHKPAWAAATVAGLALIVAAGMGLIGGIMLRRGLKDLKSVDPTPRRTLETIKEDIQWAKEQRP